MQTISIIAAMGENQEIGNQGKIPWHLPLDFVNFKRVTTGHPIIMGRKTFESIGRPLPNRTNIIITHQSDYHVDGCEVIHSFDGALKIAGDAEVFVIGGAEIYREALPIASRLYITHIQSKFPADTYFPEFDRAMWHVVENTPGLQDEQNPYIYNFVTYEKS